MTAPAVATAPIPLELRTDLRAAPHAESERRWLDIRQKKMTAQLQEGLEHQDHRRIRHALLMFLRDHLPLEFRTRRCLADLQPGLDAATLNYSDEHERAWMGGATICGTWSICPICGEKIAAEKRRDLARMLAKTEQYQVVMVVFTATHYQGDRLAPQLEALNQAFESMARQRQWHKIKDELHQVGKVWALEVTYGENGYHPHRHYLLVFERPDLANPEGKAWLESELERRIFEVYQHELRKVGLDCDREHGVRVTANRREYGQYIAKWGAAEEMTRSLHKKASGEGKHKSMLEVLIDAALGDQQAWQVWLEYAYAMRGKQQLHFDQKLRQALGLGEEISDQEAAELPELPNDEDRTVLLVDRPAYGYIDRQIPRPDLYEYTEKVEGDPDQVRDWLARRGLRRGVILTEPAPDIWEPTGVIFNPQEEQTHG